MTLLNWPDDASATRPTRQVQKQSKGRNLLDRLRKHEDGVLAFACEPFIPSTNNPAERDIRSAKVKQKSVAAFSLKQARRFMHACQERYPLFASKA
jgi:hypothetical protein